MPNQRYQRLVLNLRLRLKIKSPDLGTNIKSPNLGINTESPKMGSEIKTENSFIISYLGPHYA